MEERRVFLTPGGKEVIIKEMAEAYLRSCLMMVQEKMLRKEQIDEIYTSMFDSIENGRGQMFRDEYDMLADNYNRWKDEEEWMSEEMIRRSVPLPVRGNIARMPQFVKTWENEASIWWKRNGRLFIELKEQDATRAEDQPKA